MPPPSRRRSISRALRGTPFGILLMAAVFAMIALTAMAGGVYLAFFGSSGSVLVGVLAVVAGPAILYLCYHLVQMSRWAWLAVLVLVALLFLSSVARVAVTPTVQISSLAEILIELVIAYYLTRPGLRRAFGWGASRPAESGG
ncbi:MAG: hypothetical protein WD766_08150 [Gemmatimonadota bacterium]